jgi:hypothetical protein
LVQVLGLSVRMLQQRSLSAILGMRIPIDEILREHLESLGFHHLETLIDRIVSRRLFNSRINPATGLPDERTQTEHLLVMKKKS